MDCCRLLASCPDLNAIKFDMCFCGLGQLACAIDGYLYNMQGQSTLLSAGHQHDGEQTVHMQRLKG
jgi:hypothetical protein